MAGSGETSLSHARHCAHTPHGHREWPGIRYPRSLIAQQASRIGDESCLVVLGRSCSLGHVLSLPTHAGGLTVSEVRNEFPRTACTRLAVTDEHPGWLDNATTSIRSDQDQEALACRRNS